MAVLSRVAKLKTDSSGEVRVETVAIVGQGPEFRPLQRFLEADEHFAVRQYASLSKLARLKALRTPPQHVLLLQSRRGQFAQADVDTLRRTLPESTWLCIVGTQVEGETRCGTPLEGIDRVHWTAAVDRFRWIRGLASGHFDIDIEEVVFGAHPADRLMALNQGGQPYPDSIGVVAATSRLASCLIDTCESVGFCAEAVPNGVFQGTAKARRFDHLNLCIWSAESHQGHSPVPLETVASRLAPCPVLAIADFVRAEDYDTMVTAGAKGVLARPFVLEDLVGQISRLTRPSTLPARTKRHRQAS